MTAPEFMNSPPTVDAAIGLPQAGRNRNLHRVVERVLDQLRQLKLQRQEIAQKIAIIKRTINGLALLYGSELRPRPEDGVTFERRHEITNACRVTLNRADTPLSARKVSILQGEFPDLIANQEIIMPGLSLSLIGW